jgi:tetratricopeptide (TPR) repeat protein
VERGLAVLAGSHAPQALIGRSARRAWPLAIAIASAVAAIAAMAGSADARPKGRGARVAFDRGVAAYQKGNFVGASEALGRSFELERDVDTLFAWAQAERKLERCDKAIDLYEKILTFNLPAANKSAVEQKLAECRTVLAAQTPKVEPVPEPVPAPVVAPPPSESGGPATPAAAEGDRPTPEVAPEAPSGRSRYTDPITLGLLGGGVVALGVGGGFLFAAQSASNASKNADQYQDAERSKDTAKQRGLIGAISAGAGVALVGIGVFRILTHHESGEQRTITGWLTPGGGGVAISGPF